MPLWGIQVFGDQVLYFYEFASYSYSARLICLFNLITTGRFLWIIICSFPPILQQKLPLQEYPELKSSVLLHSFIKNEFNSLVELNIEKGFQL